MNRGQAKFYWRAQAGKHYTDLNVLNGLLDIYVNFARRNVQDDLFNLQFDVFKKVVYKTGNYFNLPTDMKAIPNNISSLLVSAGTKATITTAMTGADNDVVITAKEPGTNGNGIILTLVSDVDAGEGMSVSVSGKTITVNVNMDEGSFDFASTLITAIKNERKNHIHSRRRVFKMFRFACSK